MLIVSRYGTILLGITAAVLNVAWLSIWIRFSYDLLKSDPDIRMIRTAFRRCLRFAEWKRTVMQVRCFLVFYLRVMRDAL